MPRGSIRPKPARGADAWEIQASAGSDVLTGKRRRVTRLVHGSERDAERALTALLAELDEKAPATEGTVAHLLEVWWGQGEAGWSPTTSHNYRRIIDGRLARDFGAVKLRDLTLEQLERYYADLRRQGLKSNTVRNHAAVLRAALHLAAKWGWIPASPAAGAQVPPDRERHEASVPSPAELRALIAHVDKTNPELATALRVLADTGMRRGELCGLRWLAVDLEAGELTVRRSIAQVDGVLHEKGTKTHAVRTVALSAPTVEWLTRHRAAMVDRAAASGVELQANGFVFSREPDGSDPWRPNSVTQSFRRARGTVGVDARLHDVRHFMATEWLAAGVDVVTVSKRLGHAKTSTTVDVYGHADAERGRAAADRMGNLLD